MTPTITKAYASTAQGQIHYQYARASSFISKKKTPLIFLHKSASSSASYTSLISIYSSRGYDCYAPDMPGFGGSFDPSEDQIAAIRERGTKWYCEVFMEAFHDIGVFGKHENSVEGTLTTAHVMGHHSGACLAVELAVLYPNLINSICLVGPAVMSAEERLAMKDVYFKPFNKPETDGSHLIKTWNYLQSGSPCYLFLIAFSH
jgi:pimeloyl-ACP methyl ester carboxylesterase